MQRIDGTVLTNQKKRQKRPNGRYLLQKSNPWGYWAEGVESVPKFAHDNRCSQ
jgi:hypothetical protein